MAKESFWMVLGTSSAAAPTVRHTTDTAAKNEAKRLAQLHRGDKFVVLQSIGECMMPPLPGPEWIDHDEIPA